MTPRPTSQLWPLAVAVGVALSAACSDSSDRWPHGMPAEDAATISADVNAGDARNGGDLGEGQGVDDGVADASGNECGLGQVRCGVAGLCVGRQCFEPCSADCSEDEVCRTGANDSPECAPPWTCGPGGAGSFIGPSCEQSWTCGTAQHTVVCKGPAADPFFAGDVSCTCRTDGEATRTFTWRGYPCNGSIPAGADAQFYNAMCGWALPEP